MRKVLFMFFILTTMLCTSVFAVVPGYENSYKQFKIANYTLEFLHSNGMGGTGTFDILNYADLTDDEVIERTLKSVWTMNETYIRCITHVNGIPIEQTKWAKYGGVIQHVGGNYVFPNDPPEKPVEEPKDITVFINQEQVIFPDQQPVIIRGRTMVPIRAVFEHKFVQAKVRWDEESRTVTATDKNNRKIVFRIDENNYSYQHGIDDTEYRYSDVAPIIENSRTLLPLRALSESLDFQVEWIDEERKVEITEKPGSKRILMSPYQWELYLKNGGKVL
ncbi:MAG: copper amine oxidase N-terminal domain-containing protein [Clostridia bacterium]|nr:copper amine oxidase N-terminal domain-containing protein [Clostridia bacterium]